MRTATESAREPGTFAKAHFTRFEKSMYNYFWACRCGNAARACVALLWVLHSDSNSGGFRKCVKNPAYIEPPRMQETFAYYMNTYMIDHGPRLIRC